MMQEKLVVAEYFANKHTGRFLVIGAGAGDPEELNDPMGSLLEKEWNGVFCEPNPECCAELIKTIDTNKHKIINCAITTDGGIKQFYSVIFKSGISTISSLNVLWVSGLKPNLQEQVVLKKPIIINTITFDQLLEVVGNDFDFISIDIENSPRQIDEFVCAIDFSKIAQCKMLCIEGITPRTTQYLAQFGYVPYKSEKYLHAYYNFFYVKNIPQ